MTLTPVKGVIFDLDDTLFDCSGQLTGPARQRAANILAQAGFDAGMFVETQAALSQTLGSSGAIRELGRQYAISSHLVEQALLAYNAPTVEPIFPFPDVLPTLCALTDRHYALVVVTSGRPDRQRQKIAQLGLNGYFEERQKTLILHNDQKSADKTPCLQQAARQMALPPQAIFSVGDKLDAEIAASNRLGMTTVRLRHGRQKNRLPQTPDEHPHFEIDTLSQLLTLLP